MPNMIWNRMGSAPACWKITLACSQDLVPVTQIAHDCTCTLISASPDIKDCDYTVLGVQQLLHQVLAQEAGAACDKAPLLLLPG